MISTRSAVLALGALVLPLALTACPAPGSGTTAPKEGIVKQLQPDSVACQDKGAATVAVRYQPDGKDAAGSAWPQALACVTPEVATGLAEGGRFQE
jgi:hypothetical protein